MAIFFGRYAPHPMDDGRVSNLPSREATAVLWQMWEAHATEIRPVRDGFDSRYSIFCRERAHQDRLRRCGLTVSADVVEFDFEVDGVHYGRCFDDLTEAYIALRLLYNIFEERPLHEGLRMSEDDWR